jgi:hypothetical protein
MTLSFAIAFDIPSAKFAPLRLKVKQPFWTTSTQVSRQGNAPAIGETRKAHAVWGMCAA